MDQELRAFLEKLEARMDERDARLDEKLAGLEARMDARMDEKLAGLEARMDKRFEKVETEARHTRILVEGVSSDLRLVAEGFVGVTERLEKFQAETARGFEDVKAKLSPYYKDLNGRTQSLENDAECLDRRLKVLEGRADRQREDVLVAVRKYLGKPQVP